jgi:hypothetical protein
MMLNSLLIFNLDNIKLQHIFCIYILIGCLMYFAYSSKHGLVASGKNTLYLAGGEFPDGSASRSMWRYDPVLDVWQEMAPMLVPRSELGKHIGCTGRYIL